MPRLSHYEQQRRIKNSNAADRVRSRTLFALREALAEAYPHFGRDEALVEMIQRINRDILKTVYAQFLQHDVATPPMIGRECPRDCEV